MRALSDFGISGRRPIRFHAVFDLEIINYYPVANLMTICSRMMTHMKVLAYSVHQIKSNALTSSELKTF